MALVGHWDKMFNAALDRMVVAAAKLRLPVAVIADYRSERNPQYRNGEQCHVGTQEFWRTIDFPERGLRNMAMPPKSKSHGSRSQTTWKILKETSYSTS